MSENGVVPLEQLCDLSRSICYGIVQPGQAVDDGIPIIRVNNFRGNRVDLGEVLRVDPGIEQKFRRSRPKANDVLVSLVGSIGQVAIAPDGIDGWNLARAVGLVPAKDKHHSRWAFYALQSPVSQSFIRTHANTTVQATFNLKDLARLPIPYPDIAVRKRTIEILSSLDDKIELNRQMNETLEAMAQAIFRDWFVDFGPTRRKMESASDPVEIMGGLVTDAERAQALADLFPASLGDNGLPQGWGRARVKAFCTSTENGGTPKRSEPSYWSPGIVPWLTSSEVRSPIILDAETRISALGLEQSSAKVWPPNTTVIAMYGATAGQTALLAAPVCTNQACCGLLPLQGRDLFLFHSMREHMSRLANLAVGAAQQNLSQKTIAAYEIVQPSDALMRDFGELARPLLDKRISNERESRTLSATRDLLLPRLMSGETRLRDTEELVESAA